MLGMNCSIGIKVCTLPQARQWCRLLMTVNFMSQSMQFGASLSGIQKGGCLPSVVPDVDEFSDTSGEGALISFCNSGSANSGTPKTFTGEPEIKNSFKIHVFKRKIFSFGFVLLTNRVIIIHIYSGNNIKRLGSRRSIILRNFNVFNIVYHALCFQLRSIFLNYIFFYVYSLLNVIYI